MQLKDILRSEDGFIVPNNKSFMGQHTNGATQHMLWMSVYNEVCLGHSQQPIVLHGTPKITTAAGHVIIGPQNEDYCHMNTDRKWFFMDKGLAVMGDMWCGPTYNYIIPHGHYYQITSFSNANGGGYLHVNTNTGAYGVNWWSSDIRLKKNVAHISNGDFKVPPEHASKAKVFNRVSGLDVINRIEHFSFDVERTGEHSDCGYVAQQLEEVNPDFVMNVKQEPTIKGFDEDAKTAVENPNPMYFEDDPVIRNPKPSAIIPYITKAIQEQQEIIEQLMKRIEELEAK